MSITAKSTDDLERMVEARYPHLPHEDWLTLAEWARNDGDNEEAEFLEAAQAQWNILFSRENP